MLLPGSVLRMVAHGLEPPLPQTDVQGFAQSNSVAAGAMPDLQESSGVHSMRDSLADLQHHDPAQIFIARGISRMGFHAGEMLESHFSKYGQVIRVVGVPSKVKRVQGLRPSRTRPGSLAFVVMESVECVDRIVALGEEHVMGGITISVERFRPKKQLQGAQPLTRETLGYTSSSQHSYSTGGISSLLAGQSSQVSFARSSHAAAVHSDAGGAQGVMAELAASLGKLVAIMYEGESMRAAGVRENETMAAAQQQFHNVLSICRQRLQTLQVHGEQASPVLGALSRLMEQLVQQSEMQAQQAPCPEQHFVRAEHVADAAAAPHEQQASAARHSTFFGPPGGPSQGAPWRLPASPPQGWPPASTPLPRPGPRPRVNFSNQELADRLAQILSVAAASKTEGACREPSKLISTLPAQEQQAMPPEPGHAERSMQERNDRRATADISEVDPAIGRCLAALQDEDGRCVFIVKKSSKWGLFQAQEQLAAHFSAYGKVRRVLVVHSALKQFHSTKMPKNRSGNMAFVVMATPESVDLILKAGKDQNVAGSCVTLERFQDVAKQSQHSSSVSADSTSVGAHTHSNSNSGSGSHGSFNSRSGSAGSGGSGGSQDGSLQSGFLGSNSASMASGSQSSSNCNGSENNGSENNGSENNGSENNGSDKGPDNGSDKGSDKGSGSQDQGNDKGSDKGSGKHDQTEAEAGSADSHKAESSECGSGEESVQAKENACARPPTKGDKD